MWLGPLVCIVLIVVGLGCYFTGRCAGIEWVLMNTRIEIESDAEEEGSDDDDTNAGTA